MHCLVRTWQFVYFFLRRSNDAASRKVRLAGAGCSVFVRAACTGVGKSSVPSSPWVTRLAPCRIGWSGANVPSEFALSGTANTSEFQFAPPQRGLGRRKLLQPSSETNGKRSQQSEASRSMAREPREHSNSIRKYHNMQQRHSPRSRKSRAPVLYGVLGWTGGVACGAPKPISRGVSFGNTTSCPRDRKFE
jgi:hypothetical protein